MVTQVAVWRVSVSWLRTLYNEVLERVSVPQAVCHLDLLTTPIHKKRILLLGGQVVCLVCGDLKLYTPRIQSKVALLQGSPQQRDPATKHLRT